ncbi:tripartite tricarboxylate transporter substrate binding protein [Donghicola sp. C2-DW-16]|uniref:Tripartite tricarboxylate transporter substrate binding protein n=1 Tax=Donghicola mangrovi TaxID=2729614 RepID=A0A850QF06_9RHOB|nr:tripartite tricarboxylate transporter substrate-binding protein [Donghicola mangrovi]NVO25540.1 tripartite tricarboxylate transporter substrate binding protein [Donghicola mangrovi]NVO29413.1 tripartite tricarboxylate transporter substrate binding protein [Donghicola mangrovi]
MIFKATRLTVAALLLGATAFGASAEGWQPENPECIAPANPGGGWDFTCRQVGKSLQDQGLIEKTMQVVNLAGGGGGVAYAEVVNKRGDDSDLIVAASSATATRLAQGAYPGNTMDQVRWLASIGADYGVIAVAKDSAVNTLPELLDMIKNDPTSVAVAGGSAVGGWDHLKVLIAANAYGVEDVRKVKYIAFDGGGEAVTQLLAGSVQAFTGDISEAKGFVDSGDIKVLAVLSPERLGGEFADFPTAKEQGVDAIGANWRGFYAPAGMSDEAYDAWVAKIGTLYESAEWKEIMAANGLAPLDLRGADFQNFVSMSVTQIQNISKEIGIIK